MADDISVLLTFSTITIERRRSALQWRCDLSSGSGADMRIVTTTRYLAWQNASIGGEGVKPRVRLLINQC